VKPHKTMFTCLNTVQECDRQRDGQTDRQTDGCTVGANHSYNYYSLQHNCHM